MYHYDPQTAFEELKEEGQLPNPVHVRDMLLRAHLKPEESLELNRLFVEYQQQFGSLQRQANEILQGLLKHQAA